MQPDSHPVPGSHENAGECSPHCIGRAVTGLPLVGMRKPRADHVALETGISNYCLVDELWLYIGWLVRLAMRWL